MGKCLLLILITRNLNLSMRLNRCRRYLTSYLSKQYRMFKEEKVLKRIRKSSCFNLKLAKIYFMKEIETNKKRRNLEVVEIIRIHILGKVVKN